MKALIELLQNISKASGVFALVLLTATVAHAQDSEEADLSGKVLTPLEAQEQISADLINRAFDWSEMSIIPVKLTVKMGEVGEIYIRNKSSAKRDFRIIMEEPEDSAPDYRKYMRFGPRSFRLDPEETQLLRLIARPPSADVKEWRQRFSVQLLPKVEDRDVDEEKAEGVSIKLQGTYAVSMPVDVIR